VRFTERGQLYPVNCHRADLQPRDIVVVEMPPPRGELKLAEVDRVQFLNWRCKNTIVCKQDEFRLDGRGGYSVERTTKPNGVETLEELEDELVATGWNGLLVSRHVYTVVFAKEFASQSAAIGVRRNGIDFQIYEEGWGGPALTRFPDGRFNLVRHEFYASEVDLLEFCKEFAAKAHCPLGELASYFRPIGRKQPRPARERDELAEIRDAIGEAMTDTERGAFW
jgi:hypothetical protein